MRTKLIRLYMYSCIYSRTIPQIAGRNKKTLTLYYAWIVDDNVPKEQKFTLGNSSLHIWTPTILKGIQKFTTECSRYGAQEETVRVSACI